MVTLCYGETSIGQEQPLHKGEETGREPFTFHLLILKMNRLE